MTNIQHVDLDIDIYTYFHPQTMEQICQVRRTKDKKISQWTLKNGEWIPRGLPSSSLRPIFNVIDILSKPYANILITEGEKTCKEAIKLFPEMACITWLGGSSTASKADLSILSNKTIYLWPDNDEPGFKAMNIIGQRLLIEELNCHVFMVDIRTFDFPKGWDLADKFPAHINKNIYEFIECAKEVAIKNPAIVRTFPDLSNKNIPLNTSDNLRFILNKINLTLKYNLMNHRIEYISPNPKPIECYYSDIISECSRLSMPYSKIDAHLEAIALSNPYHPVRDWIESKAWDNISRIEEFMKTIDSSDSLTSIFVYKWMIGAVAALYSDKGLSLPSVLVFQGDQGIGKTAWFKKLTPPDFQREGMIFDVNSKDSIISVTSTWLVELGEIASTYRKSDVDALKAFVTRNEDVYRAPYGRSDKIVPRRTSFFGSVNDPFFLHDRSGNRRWWTIPVKSLNYSHTIDMQQLWAEIKVAYLQRTPWWLSEDELQMLNTSNEKFEVVDIILEKLYSVFNFDSSPDTWMSTTEITEILRLGSNLKGDATRVGTILKQLNIPYRKTKKCNQFFMPRKFFPF